MLDVVVEIMVESVDGIIERKCDGKTSLKVVLNMYTDTAICSGRNE